MSLKDLGSDPVVRVKREAATVCKYRKGEWSPCEPLTQVRGDVWPIFWSSTASQQSCHLDPLLPGALP